ncbi:MAG: UDP-N-acetylglucosamine--N-acetylmuramyl-(pentapeptide) pyrophosphoryl-undecaprenol N-acetylglucosamine transferase, partial [Planctomycetes bacterium]|nr:UDP-N-acetylglucosamine--N-acetylmuramyl-(pentapeptide) pyrophosphoryl-undecaprenol N-acetylglucosamine transferase [Planctomycetota bacterium]
YVAGPAIVAASKLGLRTAILNPDAIPGRANRRLARCADLVVLQWERSRVHFPDDINCQALGCPIRDCFANNDVEAARRRFGLDPKRPTLLVTGASQGARTVNEAMMLVWPLLAGDHPQWQLLHLTGPSDEQRVRDAYASAGALARVLSFTHDMHLALAAADVVVSRAGASTLAELTALGKPSVLLPYPYHRDRHQHANAQVLVDAGAAVMLEDSCDAETNCEPLAAALTAILGNGAYRGRLGSSSAALSRPHAAAAVAEWMLSQAS